MNKTKNKLLLGLGLVTTIALPLSMVSCANEEKILTSDIANGLFEVGGKWEDKTTFGSEDLKGFVGITKEAFGNRDLTSVELHDGITSIGELAFQSNLLTSITIPNSVTTIGDNAFSNNKFTLESKIQLPEKFNTPLEFTRIGLPFQNDLQSTAKSINEIEKIEASDISQLTKDYQTVNDTSLKLIKKLFNVGNSTDDNLKKGLEIKTLTFDETYIYLRTKNGYIFNSTTPYNQEIQSVGFSISSAPATPTSILLIAKEESSLEPIYSNEVSHLDGKYRAVNDTSLKLIKKLFTTNGTDATLIEGLEIKIVAAAESKKIVWIRSKEGFKINGNLTSIKSTPIAIITSTTNIMLHPKPTLEDILQNDIAHLTEGYQAVNDASVALIKKLFIYTGSDADLINGLEIMIAKDVEGKKVIWVKAKDGFNINTFFVPIKSSSFTPIINLDLNANPSPELITKEEVAHLNGEFQVVNDASVALIKKLFIYTGSDADLINGLTIKMVTIGTNNIVTVKAKEFFTVNGIGNEFEVESRNFASITNLVLTKISVEAIIEEHISHIEVNKNYQAVNEASLSLIKELFDVTNLSDTDLTNGLEIKIVATGENHVVWIRTKEGFIINGNLTEFSSNSFVTNIPITHLEIHENTHHALILQSQVERLGKEPIRVDAALVPLIRELFIYTGSDSDLIKGLEIMIDDGFSHEQGKHIIRLQTINDFFTINGGTSTRSAAFTIHIPGGGITNVVLDRNRNIGTILETEVSHLNATYQTINDASLKLIRKLFTTHSNDVDLKNGFMIKMDTTDGGKVVTVKGIDHNWTINELHIPVVSKTFAVTAPEQDKKIILTRNTTFENLLESQVQHLYGEYVNVNASSVALIKILFNGETLSNEAYLTEGLQIRMTAAGPDGNSKQVWLRTKKGFIINGNSREISSSIFKALPKPGEGIIDLKLTTNQNSIEVLQTEISGLTDTYRAVSDSSLKLIRKLFVTYNNNVDLKNGLDVKMTSNGENKQIWIKSKNHAFTLNGNYTNELVSKTFTVKGVEIKNIELTLNQTPTTILNTEVAHLNGEWQNVNDASVSLIKKLFIVRANDQVLKTGLMIMRSAAGPDGQSQQIWLRTNKGFIIDYKFSTLQSLVFVPTVNLQLSANETHEAITNVDISHLNETYQSVNDSTVGLIRKLFKSPGFNNDHLKNGLMIKVTADGENQVISIKSKDTFTVHSSLTELNSKSFIVHSSPASGFIDLKLTANLNRVDILKTEIAGLDETYKPVNDASLTLVKKLFVFKGDTSTDEYLKKGLLIKIVNDELNKKVILKYNKGFSINGKLITLESTSFLLQAPIAFEFTVNQTPGPINNNDLSHLNGEWQNVNDASVSLIKKLFVFKGDTPTDESFKTGLMIMRSAAGPDGQSQQIWLRTKNGLTINGSTSIKSAIFKSSNAFVTTPDFYSTRKSL